MDEQTRKLLEECSVGCRMAVESFEQIKEYVKDTEYHTVLLNEHRELVKAMLEGKKDEARKIMKKHIDNQEMTVIRNIKEEN